MKSHCAPVLLIVFNRPDLTLRVFEQIRAARPPKLYVAADGPRSTEEELLCAEVRSIASQVDWPCTLFTLFRNHNMGCKLAVSQAISWFFEHEEMGIVLEDDCLPLPHFFDFCSSMLPVYAQHPQIGHISGYTAVQPLDPTKYHPHSHQVTHYAHIWGWAGYRRVWQCYNVNPLQERGFSVKVIPGSWQHQMFWLKSLLKVEKGYTKTWDFQYQYCLWKMKLWSVIPYQNYIENIGFDPRATHTSHAIMPITRYMDPNDCKNSTDLLPFSRLLTVDNIVRNQFFKRNSLILIVRLLFHSLLFYSKKVVALVKSWLYPTRAVMPNT